MIPHPPFRLLDLTQPLGPGTIMWPGSDPPSFSVTESYSSSGSFTRSALIAEHTGTHIDAPAHFVEGAATVDQIPVERLVCAVAMVSTAVQSQSSPGYRLTIADLERDESVHGPVPPDSVVVVHTGWDRYVADADRYLGRGAQGQLNFPGVSVEAANWLVRERHICGLGIDTPGVDAGADTDFTVHRTATLPHSVWHLEGLVNLAHLPPRGALIFVGALPFVGGSGAPARVMALF